LRANHDDCNNNSTRGDTFSIPCVLSPYTVVGVFPVNGANCERELCTELWKKQYATLRAPGSGSIDRPSPDVVAIDKSTRETSVYAFELKASQDGTAHFSREEITALDEWANRAKAYPLVGLRPDMRKFDGWLFQEVRELHETDKGYSIRLKDHDDCFSLEWF
jgi:Holliday junction resolvase